MRPSLFSAVIFALTAPWMLIVSMFNTTSFRQQKLLGALFTAVLASVMDLGTGDGFRHQLMVEEYYAYLSFPDFFAELLRIVTFRVNESGARDVYKHVVSYLVGSVFGQPRLFFPIVAFVYGYFFTGSVLLVLRHFKWQRTNYVVFGFVVVFFMVKGLAEFYTVRTWTGLWILFYASVRYFELRQRKYLLLMLVPPFVHFGYFLMILPALAVVFLGNRRVLFATAFMVSSVTTLVPVDDAASALSQTELGAQEVEAYKVNETGDSTQQFERSRRSANWYIAFRRAGLQRWAPTVLAYLLLLTQVYVARMSRFHAMVFSVGLVTLTFANLTWFLYALHNRALVIAMVFLVAGFLLARLDPATQHIFRGLPPYYRWGLHLCLLLFIPWIAYTFSALLDRVSVYAFGLPFLVWWDPELNISTKELLRAILGA